MQRFSVFRLMFGRFVRERYLRNVAGPFWVFAVPLAQLAIYAYVFVEVFKAKVPEAVGVGFVPFLALAFWPWLAFAEGAQRASGVLIENRDLLGKIAIPAEVLPAASLSASFVLHVLGYFGVLIVLALTGVDFVWSGLPVVVIMLVCVYLFALALSWALAVAQVLFRDVQHIFGPLFMLWFFATPVLYSPTLIPDSIRGIASLNPMYYLVERIRSAMIAGEVTPTLSDVLILAGLLVLAGLSLAFFQRSSRYIRDYL